MKARVATWEGGDEAAIQRNLDEIRSHEEDGPPEGIPSVGLMALRNGDRLVMISLFETEEDLRQGDATLNAMSPTEEMGRRVSVDFYDVPIKFDAQRS